MTILTGIRGGHRHIYTKISGDLEDLKAKVARVQDNAEELLALLKEHVTEEQAMHYGFITNVVKALEMRGYGRKIRFTELSCPRCRGMMKRRWISDRFLTMRSWKEEASYLTR